VDGEFLYKVVEGVDYVYTTNLQNQASDPDPWVRSMIRAITIADMLGISTVDAKKRLEWANALQVASRKWQRCILNVYKGKTTFPYITVCLNTWAVLPGKAASYETPAQKPYGTLTIHPGIFAKQLSYEHVIAHELIHAILADYPQSTHNIMYKKIATALGLTARYLVHYVF